MIAWFHRMDTGRDNGQSRCEGKRLLPTFESAQALFKSRAVGVALA